VIEGLRSFAQSILLLSPTSKSIRMVWNLGRLLGIVLLHQIITGLLLSMHFKPDRSLAFNSVQYIILEVPHGWFLRIRHFNGASYFFILLYLHFLKGLFFFRYRLIFVWIRGITIILVYMAEAFMGYVLVWGQIRYWAAIVITSLLRVVPYIRLTLLLWVWGGFGVNNSTLGFFFVLHFLLPLASLMLVIYHLHVFTWNR